MKTLFSELKTKLILQIQRVYTRFWGFPGGSDGKESACNVGELSYIPGSGGSSGEGNGSPLQDSCLENSTDRGGWRATVHRIRKSQTRLSVTDTLAFGFILCSREIRSIKLDTKTYFS